MIDLIIKERQRMLLQEDYDIDYYMRLCDLEVDLVGEL